MKLYSYWRSTAAYRVRIALALKDIPFEFASVHLVREGGEQHSAEYASLNPGRTVPTLVTDDGVAITQSLAAIEYLDETWPTPALLPGSAQDKAHIRSLSALIACDVHPVNNLRVGAYLKGNYGRTQDDVIEWMGHWMKLGFSAYQAQLSKDAVYSVGESVTLADLCLVPQLYNARRWNVDLDPYPELVTIEQRCMTLPAFQVAAPEQQPDSA